jgi:shikimate dehydrogenase
MKKFFGIIGNPIKHSLSPVLHKYWFKKYGIDADYTIIEATDKELPEIVKKIKNGDYSGINVTLPFKQKIINYIDKAVNDAELTGSVNTVLLNNDKIVIGENTDVYGLQAAYLKEIENNFNKRALVIGAGGVSPSVILSVKKSGIKNISITNRTSEKCIFLKKKI